MKTISALLSLVLLFSGCIFSLQAQDLVIANARIIDGNGTSPWMGNIVIRNGMIASITTDSHPAGDVQLIDAQGKTVMPGFIDTHRHLIRSQNPTEWMSKEAATQMRSYLDAGFTTVFSNGDPLEEILELRHRLSQGDITGPRLLTSGRIDIALAPEKAREEVQRVVTAGVDAIKVWTQKLDDNQKATLKAIIDESRQQGVPSIIHATRAEDMTTAVEMGVSKLVHTPHTGEVSKEMAEMVAKSGVPMSSTLGVYTPTFDDNNIARLWPGGRPSTLTDENLKRGTQGMMNSRILWDAGMVYAYGTDTFYHPQVSLAHEIAALQVFFSAKDIIAMLTANAGRYLNNDEIGTLVPGKIADIVIVDGDPMEDIDKLLQIDLVIKDGKIVVDNR